jgi:hypothetical protein
MAFGQEFDTSMVDLLSDYQCHSRSGSGDPFMVPLLESEDHWPWINHEFLSMSTADDPRLEPKYGTGYAPNLTMDAAKAAARSAGLTWEQAESCIEAGFRIQSIFHKIGLESARLDPRLDGFSMWLLLDFPPATWNGLLNIFHEPKHSTKEYFRTFNQPVVLLAQDPDPKPGLFLRKSPILSLWPPVYEFDEVAIKDRTTAEPVRMRPIPNAFYDWPIYTSGQTFPVEWVVSNFGDAPVSNEELTWRLLDGRKVVAEGSSSDVDAPVGHVGRIGLAEIALPHVTKPLKATVEISLTGGKWSNSWDLWIFPEVQERADLGQKLAASEGLHDLLASRYRDVVRIGSPGAQDARVLIADSDGDAIVGALEKGKKVLCLSVPPQVSIGVQARLGNWIWTEQAGTAIEADHPAFGDFPNEAFLNQPWFRLMSHAAKLTPGGPVNNAEKLMFGNGSAGYFACVFEANSGNGSVLVSGLDLTSETHRNMPESAYLLDQMIRYVASDGFSPTGSVAPSIFQGFATLATLRRLSGFDRTVETVPPQSSSYGSGLFGVLPAHYVRQTDGEGTLTWRTKPLAESDINDDGEAVFRWAASTGWFSEPEGGFFTLFLNGRELLEFDVSTETATWQMPDQLGVLSYDVLGFTREDRQDTVGIMKLTLPAGTVSVGESVELGVQGSDSSSRRFFMLYEVP